MGTLEEDGGTRNVAAVYRILNKRYRESLVRWLGKKYDWRIDTEFVAQFALEDASHRYSGKDPERDNVTSLLRTIAAHKALDQLKSKVTRRSVSLGSLGDSFDVPSRRLADDPARLYARKHREELFGQRMRRVPKLERFVLILHGINNVSFKDTAKRLGLTMDQVRTKWKKGAESYLKAARTKERMRKDEIKDTKEEPDARSSKHEQAKETDRSGGSCLDRIRAADTRGQGADAEGISGATAEDEADFDPCD